MNTYSEMFLYYNHVTEVKELELMLCHENGFLTNETLEIYLDIFDVL